MGIISSTTGAFYYQGQVLENNIINTPVSDYIPVQYFSAEQLDMEGIVNSMLGYSYNSITGLYDIKHQVNPPPTPETPAPRKGASSAAFFGLSSGTWDTNFTVDVMPPLNAISTPLDYFGGLGYPFLMPYTSDLEYVFPFIGMNNAVNYDSTLSTAALAVMQKILIDKLKAFLIINSSNGDCFIYNHQTNQIELGVDVLELLGNVGDYYDEFESEMDTSSPSISRVPLLKPSVRSALNPSDPNHRVLMLYQKLLGWWNLTDQDINTIYALPAVQGELAFSKHSIVSAMLTLPLGETRIAVKNSAGDIKGWLEYYQKYSVNEEYVTPKFGYGDASTITFPPGVSNEAPPLVIPGASCEYKLNVQITSLGENSNFHGFGSGDPPQYTLQYADPAQDKIIYSDFIPSTGQYFYEYKFMSLEIDIVTSSGGAVSTLPADYQLVFAYDYTSSERSHAETEIEYADYPYGSSLPLRYKWDEKVVDDGYVVKKPKPYTDIYFFVKKMSNTKYLMDIIFYNSAEYFPLYLAVRLKNKTAGSVCSQFAMKFSEYRHLDPGSSLIEQNYIFLETD